MAAEWWALGVSVAAFITAVTKDFILPTIFKPRLTLEGKNDDECLDEALRTSFASNQIEKQLRSQGVDPDDAPQNFQSIISENKKKSRWIRLRLRNNGGLFGLSVAAKNCYVKLIEIRNSKNQRIKPFNAFPLMWVSYATSKNNLAKGEYHLLDIAYENEGERIIYPATYNGFGLPDLLLERKTEKLGPDVYTFRLGVYGDNFDPCIREFKIALTQKFGELKFAE